jgi:hypothetical protein
LLIQNLIKIKLNTKTDVQQKLQKYTEKAWTSMFATLNNVIQGAQLQAYKIMQHLHKLEKDTAQINNIPEDV